VIFQSWSQTASGEKLYPDNLPESQRDTMTQLLLDIVDRYGLGPKEAH